MLDCFIISKMMASTDRLVPIVGLHTLYGAASILSDTLAPEEERAEIESLFDSIVESALYTIEMQLDHVKGDHDPDKDFGRILAIAKHCLSVYEEEGKRVAYPQVAPPGEGIFVNGLVISARTGLGLEGEQMGELPKMEHARWDEGVYLQLVSSSRDIARAVQEDQGFWVPLPYSDLFNPNPHKIS